MTLETENADSMSSSESTLRIWGQESAFEQTGWWGVGHSPPGQGSWASTCISLFCAFSTSLASSLTSSCVYRAQLIAGVREVHPPWVESQTHHFLMCHQPQRAHSAARADPGAWSPAWSRPDQKEDDSQVSSTSQRPGNSKAPEAIWASVRTLSKYEEE